MTRYLLLILCVISAFFSNAQQQILFDQYFINDVIYNPAISGSKTYNPLVIQTRQQWAGFDDAPFSTSISYHQAIKYNTAIGGFLNVENSYPSKQLNFQLNYAYHIPLNSNNTYISFGLGPKFMLYSLNFNREDLPDLNDPAFSFNEHNEMLADFSSGFYLYNENFSLGFSALNILQSSFNGEVFTNSLNQSVNNNFGENIEVRHFYFTSSFRGNIINNDWEIEPYLQISSAENQTSLIRFSSRIIFLKDNWLSFGLGNNGLISSGIGFKANNIYLGYSYGQQLSGEIVRYNYGSHELSLTFKLPSYNQKERTSFWY